jgi:hypothetical protein
MSSAERSHRRGLRKAFASSFSGSAGDTAARDVQVVASEPTQIANGQLIVDPIDGDAADSIRPNGWLVQAFNDGGAPVIVRPCVVCADID